MCSFASDDPARSLYLRDIEELAPDALVLNCTNPLTRVCLALTRYTNLRIVGLCHGIAHAYRKVGHVMGWVTVPRGYQ